VRTEFLVEQRKVPQLSLLRRGLAALLLVVDFRELEEGNDSTRCVLKPCLGV